MPYQTEVVDAKSPALIRSKLRCFLRNEQLVGMLLIALSTCLFGTTYFTQYLLLLDPGELWLLQRWIFGLVISLGIAALLAPGHTFKGTLFLIAAVSLLGDTSVGIASFYADQHLFSYPSTFDSASFAEVFARVTSPNSSEDVYRHVLNRYESIFTAISVFLSFLLSLIALHSGIDHLVKGISKKVQAN